MTAIDLVDLLDRARTGDSSAFEALTTPYRRELLVHCYRMLGSVDDAEDVLQDALLAAWQGIGGFEERSSVRSWLYRIATNRCLNARRTASRRPKEVPFAPVPGMPEPTGLGEVAWLQPFPDRLLAESDPEASVERTEALSLAFVTALQTMPPRQVATLLLRDVLGFRAREVAGMLDLTEDAVTSALRRARATLADRRPDPAVATAGAAEDALLRCFVAAFVSEDVDALVALLTEDVWVRMPPLPYEYQGRRAARAFFAAIDQHRRTIAAMVPVGVNRQPAWGEYVRDPRTTRLRLVGMLVVTVRGDQLGELTHFESGIAAYCGLPRVLP